MWFGAYAIMISVSMQTAILDAMLSKDFCIALKGDILAEEEFPEELIVEEDKENLPELFLKGSEDAFEKIVEKYKKMVYFTSYHILRNSEAAMDATQEVFIKTYKSLASFKGKSKLRTWIYRITVNHCLNQLRSQIQRKNTISLDETTEVSDAGDKSPRKILEKSEMKEKIERAIEQLPDQQRIIFILRNFNNLTFEEIAETLQRSIGGIKASYFHAVRKMRDFLSETEGAS